MATEALIKYFKKSLPKLASDYSWKIPPSLEEFGLKGEGYEPNKNLKFYFQKKWKMASRSEKQEIAKIVVSDWGGVKANKSETLQHYVDHISTSDFDMPLKGVASYSKILAIVDPLKFAIYDARVAVSLIATQFLCENTPRVAFHYVPGRNKITGDNQGRGFVHHPVFTRKALKDSGWNQIPSKDNYNQYIKTLLKVRDHLRSIDRFRETELYDLEMSLFANAEKLATEAMEKAETRDG